jgi:hypothetical protein
MIESRVVRDHRLCEVENRRVATLAILSSRPSIGEVMKARQSEDRRRDTATAERIDLAVRTCRAFNYRSAEIYLRLSGVPERLVDAFRHRYPAALRPVGSLDGRFAERRVAFPGARQT